jgi:bacillithiol biosynthesis deacetylase BshB1
MAVGAHPDDVEVGIGGIIHKLAAQGRRVGILDLTRGEMGSRGTSEEREREAREAARRLGIANRANAGLPDGAIANDDSARRVIVKWIREWRPGVLIVPMDRDRHPDHEAAHALIRDANYLAGLSKLDTGLSPHRAPIVYYFRVYGDPTEPQLVVDISAHFEVKLEALRAYRSQLYNPDYSGPATYVSSKAFWDGIRSRAAYWGSRIGVAYGEPLYHEGPVGVTAIPGAE